MISKVNCLFSYVNHEYTKEVFRQWCKKNYGKSVGVKVDWGNMSPREIQKLSEKMFDAAKVPEATRRQYYRALNEFLYNLPKDAKMSRGELNKYSEMLRKLLHDKNIRRPRR